MPVIHRFEIPVDDEWHAVEECSTPLHVGCRTPGVVEFWAWQRTDLAPRWFRVIGTGHPVPDGAEYRGTVVAPGGALVWHLVERR